MDRLRADTLLIHQAVLASTQNPTDAQIMIFSPDTDVLVPAVANCHLLLEQTQVSMVSSMWGPLQESLAARGQRHCLLCMGSEELTVSAIQSNRQSNIAEYFFESWKWCCWCPAAALGGELSKWAAAVDSISFIHCDAYSLKGIHIHSILELRWYLFCKHMTESDRLTSRMGALKQHVLRVPDELPALKAITENGGLSL